MNITLNGTKITQDTRNLAFEKNNNVDEIVVTVDTDESWSYKLDVKYPDKFNIGKDALYNIIDLNRNGIICSVILTREMLPFNGKYTMQLRGINGDKVYHSDTFEVWVKYSIEPGSTYNPVPSEFYQVEARLDDKVDEVKQYAENAETASTRMPKISPDNTWLIWDAETGDYVDTGIVASGGTTDHSKLINRSAADQHPMSAITGLEKALESKQPAGAYLTDKDLDTTLKETGKAADAAEVGKRLSSLSEEIANFPQPDWNQNDDTQPDYVKNRTHYEERIWADYVLNMDVNEISGFSLPEVGETVTVKINGVESTETVKEAESSIMGFSYKYIGNTDIDSMQTGGTGWLVAEAMGQVIGSANPDTTITVETIVVHKIDDKFVNLDGFVRTFDYHFKNYTIYKYLYNADGSTCTLYTCNNFILPEPSSQLLGFMGGFGISLVESALAQSCFVKSYIISTIDGSTELKHTILGTNTAEMEQLATIYGYTLTTKPKV